MRYQDLSYFNDPEFKELLDKYEAAIQDGGEPYFDPGEFTDIAEYYMMNEREEEANQCIDLALTIHPNANDPQIFLARQQLFHGNLTVARQLARTIPDQEDREVKFFWAEWLIRKEQPEEAHQMLEEYGETVTEERDFFLYDTANIFTDYDQWEIATRWAKRLKEEFPNFKNTDLLISDIMVSTGRVAEAMPLLQGILDTDPFNRDAWNLLAEAESGQEHYAESLEAIDYLLAIDEHNPQAWLIRANCLFHLNRLNEAHEQYLFYLEEEPKDFVTRYFDGVTLTNLERFDDALMQLELALSHANKEAAEYLHILLQLSYVLSKLRRKDEAIKRLDQAHAISDNATDDEYQLLLGQIYLDNQDVHTANQCFLEALRTTQKEHDTMLFIGISYAEASYFSTAVNIFTELLTTDMPERDARILPYLAYCLFFMPDKTEYERVYALARQANPTLTEYLFSPVMKE
ncbi:MAG: tetratricopeptide repeat protein [Bacteroidales bacterium]|nr:tetratricopeptide repeat protein [Candidatus Physcousia equi]